MAEVPGLSFGSTVNVLTDAMQGASLQHDQIANNIANVDTPNFRRSDVSFKSALARSLGAPPDSNALPMKVDSSRQFAIGDGTPPIPFDPQAKVDESIQMRVDKSNVDIDQEMAKLAANSGYGQDMAQMLREQFMRYRLAITEQPR